MTQGRNEVEVGTLLLGSNKNIVIANQVYVISSVKAFGTK